MTNHISAFCFAFCFVFSCSPFGYLPPLIPTHGHTLRNASAENRNLWSNRPERNRALRPASGSLSRIYLIGRIYPSKIGVGQICPTLVETGLTHQPDTHYWLRCNRGAENDVMSDGEMLQLFSDVGIAVKSFVRSEGTYPQGETVGHFTIGVWGVSGHTLIVGEADRRLLRGNALLAADARGLSGYICRERFNPDLGIVDKPLFMTEEHLCVKRNGQN